MSASNGSNKPGDRGDDKRGDEKVGGREIVGKLRESPGNKRLSFGSNSSCFSTAFPRSDEEKEAYGKAKFSSKCNGSMIVDIRHHETFWTLLSVQALCRCYQGMIVDFLKLTLTQLFCIVGGDFSRVVIEGPGKHTVSFKNVESSTGNLLVMPVEDFFDLHFGGKVFDSVIVHYEVGFKIIASRSKMIGCDDSCCEFCDADDDNGSVVDLTEADTEEDEDDTKHKAVATPRRHPTDSTTEEDDALKFASLTLGTPSVATKSPAEPYAKLDQSEEYSDLEEDFACTQRSPPLPSPSEPLSPLPPIPYSDDEESVG